MNKLEAQILINDLKLKIKELESDKHLNKIKANYLSELIKRITQSHKEVDPLGIYNPAIDIPTLNDELKNLRGKVSKSILSDVKLFTYFKHDGRILQLIDNDFLEQWAVGYDQKTGEVIDLNLYINVEPINVDIIEINNR